MAVTFVNPEKVPAPEQMQVEVPLVVQAKKGSIKFSPKLIPQEPAQSEKYLEELAHDYLLTEFKLKALGVKALQDKQAEIKKKLTAFAEKELMPSDTLTISCDQGSLLVSACAKSRQVVDMQGLFNLALKKVGEEATLAAFTITLGNLAKILSESEAAPFLKEVHGSRRITAELK